MPWTTPATAVAGSVLTAAFWNTHVRDNMNYLYSASPRAAEFNAGNTGTAITLDFATNGPIQKVTRNGNCTITLTAPALPMTVMVKLVHDGTATAYTVGFSPTVKWPNGVAATYTNTAGAIDLVTLFWDGTAWFGVPQAAFA